MDKKFLLTIILLSGLALRIILSPYFTHHYDVNTFKYWANQLTVIGFEDYFSKISWNDYLPFYLYILFAIEKIQQTFHFSSDLIYKMPGILADILSGIIIYLLASKLSTKKRLLLVSLYIFNPAIFANSAMWGQVDGLGAFLMLLSLYLYTKQKIIFLSVVLAMVTLFKPLYLLAIPLFAVAQLRRDFKKLFILVPVTFLSAILIAAPFTADFVSSPLLIYERYTTSLGQYHYASVNAFNFWTMVGQNWKSDEVYFGGLTYHTWGLLIFIVIFGLANLNLLIKKYSEKSSQFLLPFSLAITYLAIYTFATRVHERHMLTALPFFLLLIYDHPFFLSGYIFLSGIYLINLYFGIQYLFLNGVFIFDDLTTKLYSSSPVIVSIILLGILVYMLIKNVKPYLLKK